MLTAGKKAPPLRLPSTSGRDVDLAQLRGRKVIVYFYPRDDTPGCTREACGFRDHMGRLQGAGAEVFGISKDSLAAHERFRAKYSLPFELLTDAGNVAARAWGAYGEKTMYGKKVEGTIRSTYLIDEQGNVARVWSPVKVDGHVDAVLAALAGESDGKPAAGREKSAKSAKKAKAAAKPAPAAGKKTSKSKARKTPAKRPAPPAKRSKPTAKKSKKKARK